jgi:hypothetical protein
MEKRSTDPQFGTAVPNLLNAVTLVIVLVHPQYVVLDSDVACQKHQEKVNFLNMTKYLV